VFQRLNGSEFSNSASFSENLTFVTALSPEPMTASRRTLANLLFSRSMARACSWESSRCWHSTSLVSQIWMSSSLASSRAGVALDALPRE
jgi:hypothetical protein